MTPTTIPSDITILCSYGCGNTAKYELSSGTYCCQDSVNKCPAQKAKNSQRAKERWAKGVYTNAVKEGKLSHSSWNKGMIFKKPIPGKCKICGKDHDGSYGSGKFCSEHCAKVAGTQYIDKDKWRQKISATLRSRSLEEIQEACNKAMISYNRNHPGFEKAMPHQIVTIKNYNVRTKNFQTITVRKRHVCRICGSLKGSCEHPLICKYLSSGKVSGNLVKLGFDTSTLGSCAVYNEFFKIRDLLFHLYIDEKLSAVEIQKKYGFSDWSVIYSLLKRFNIPIRKLSEAIQVSIETGRLDYSKLPNNQYKSFKHRTWFGTEVTLRSSYEEDFANQLDSKKIKYEVESLRVPFYSNIRKKHAISIPDFYIPETNTIYEIKGDFTYTKRDIEDRFAAYKRCGISNIVLVLEHKEYIYPNLPEQRCKKTIDDYWN